MPTSVYVVDDERTITDTLTAILNVSGYDALGFYDAESALVACEVKCPDCIISDVVMPGIDGVAMALQIRQRFPACKVLLFSGQAATRDMLKEARRRGYEFEVLSKPVHPFDLLAMLKSDGAAALKHGPAAIRASSDDVPNIA